MTEPTTAAGPLDLDKAVADMRKVLPTVVAEIERLARQQDGSALRSLLDAIETMDQKITPYGEREDGTILHYIVADSTWHRILAAARSPHWSALAALSPGAPPALDAPDMETKP